MLRRQRALKPVLHVLSVAFLLSLVSDLSGAQRGLSLPLRIGGKRGKWIKWRIRTASGSRVASGKLKIVPCEGGNCAITLIDPIGYIGPLCPWAELDDEDHWYIPAGTTLSVAPLDSSAVIPASSAPDCEPNQQLYIALNMGTGCQCPPLSCPSCPSTSCDSCLSCPSAALSLLSLLPLKSLKSLGRQRIGRLLRREDLLQGLQR